MKKPIVLGLMLVTSLMLVAGPLALAWQEGPSTDWWYINPNVVGGDYENTPPLIIKLNGNSSTGQVFLVGDIITISVDISIYAVSTAGEYPGHMNYAYTEWYLEVTGPSPTDFDWGNADDTGATEAEVETIMTLSFDYTPTDPSTHTAYAATYAEITQYEGYIPPNPHELVVDELLEAWLTFEVLERTKANVLKRNGVPGKGIADAPGLQKLVPNDNFAKGTSKETVGASLTFEVVPTKAEVLQGNGVSGKGVDHAPGLQKEVPNDNFAKGTSK